MGRPPKPSLPNELSELLKTVGRNLRAIREEKGFSQADLARKAKVSLSTLNEIEKRKFRDIRLSTLSALAKSLGVPTIRLLEKVDLKINQREQQKFLKASEDIWRIAQKLKS